MKQILKNTLVLLIITLLAGLSLALVHALTRDPIAAAQEEAKQAAYREVMPDAAGFADCRADLAAFESENGVTVDEVREAQASDGSRIGWVMSLTSPHGYGGDIRIVIGVTEESTVTGMTVIEMSETPGVGAKCTGAEFRSQFAGIAAGPITAVKNGKTAPDEIDAISGATYTTDAIVEAVNTGLKLAGDVLVAGGKS